jgi:hypothetical protein
MKWPLGVCRYHIGPSTEAVSAKKYGWQISSGFGCVKMFRMAGSNGMNVAWHRGRERNPPNSDSRDEGAPSDMRETSDRRTGVRLNHSASDEMRFDSLRGDCGVSPLIPSRARWDLFQAFWRSSRRSDPTQIALPNQLQIDYRMTAFLCSVKQRICESKKGRRREKKGGIS